MSGQGDPDAHLGPRARQANREERVDLSRLTATLYVVTAALFVFVAARDLEDVMNVILAVAWVLLAGAWWWRYRRSERLAGSNDTARPEDES